MAIDVLAPFRAAVQHFGVPVTVSGGDPVEGLLDSAEEFAQVTGIPVAHGAHVLQVEPGALGSVALGAVLTIDGDEYVHRGPVEGDLATQALQVVPRRATPE